MLNEILFYGMLCYVMRFEQKTGSNTEDVQTFWNNIILKKTVPEV